MLFKIAIRKVLLLLRLVVSFFSPSIDLHAVQYEIRIVLLLLLLLVLLVTHVQVLLDLGCQVMLVPGHVPLFAVVRTILVF